jgi:hypothetical protein
MKKLIVSILAVFYLGSSSGATIHFHYCMGKLVNWGLKDEGNKCHKCGMEKDGGCCKDEYKLLKNGIDQKTVESAIYFFLNVSVVTPQHFYIASESYSSSLIEEHPIIHAPPLKSGVEILIHNCILRI